MRATVFLILIFIGFNTKAQIDESNALFTELQKNDAALFKIGFNQCDMTVTASLIADDLEFYHDQGGVDKGKAAFIDTMQSGLCKGGTNKIRRHLVSGSLQVFPMADRGKIYGAIQMGHHQFAPAGQKPEGLPAKFIHLWLLEDGKWKISRVLSYDHH